MTFVKPISLK